MIDRVVQVQVRDIVLGNAEDLDEGRHSKSLFVLQIPVTDDWNERRVILLNPLGDLGHQGDAPVILVIDHVVERALVEHEDESILPVLEDGLVGALTPARRSQADSVVDVVSDCVNGGLIFDWDVDWNRIVTVVDDDLLLIGVKVVRLCALRILVVVETDPVLVEGVSVVD